MREACDERAVESSRAMLSRHSRGALSMIAQHGALELPRACVLNVDRIHAAGRRDIERLSVFAAERAV
ncbi:MAG: hypothetical protein RIR10_1778 [Planctomycetota bacterium]